MIARSFCELFVAGCLEVRSEEVEGRVRRLYRTLAGLDLGLLGPLERALARYLQTERSFDEVLALAGARGREAELLAEMGEVIDEALEYLPPGCSCSV